MNYFTNKIHTQVYSVGKLVAELCSLGFVLLKHVNGRKKETKKTNQNYSSVPVM